MFETNKPPLGLMPRCTHKRMRFQDICDAIVRYYSSNLEIPIVWVEEYNELLKEIGMIEGGELLK